MDNFTLIFGVFALVIGLVSLYGYITNNQKLFSKRESFKKVWGEKFGTYFHFFGYVIVPIAAGVYLITVNLMVK